MSGFFRGLLNAGSQARIGHNKGEYEAKNLLRKMREAEEAKRLDEEDRQFTRSTRLRELDQRDEAAKSRPKENIDPLSEEGINATVQREKRVGPIRAARDRRNPSSDRERWVRSRAITLTRSGPAEGYGRKRKPGLSIEEATAQAAREYETIGKAANPSPTGDIQPKPNSERVSFIISEIRAGRARAEDIDSATSLTAEEKAAIKAGVRPEGSR